MLRHTTAEEETMCYSIALMEFRGPQGRLGEGGTLVPRFYGFALHSRWNGKSIPPGVAITVQETKFTELRQEVESLWKADGMIPINRVHRRQVINQR